MTGPTHVAIVISAGMIVGAEPLTITFLAAGALVPDLDTHKSIIGRIFLPISIPLGKWLGHRGAFHSFWLWGLVILSGLLFNPMYFIGTGALIHVVSDCWTVSGVRAMTPFSSKIFVLFQRSWRFKTGGNAEMGILLVAGTIAWTGYKIGTMGGLAGTMGYLLKAPKIMVDEYKHKGLMKCKIDGRFRYNSGETVDGIWTLIGLHGTKVSFLIDDRIITDGNEGMLLKARLIKSDEQWSSVKVNGWATTINPVFYFTDGKWFIGNPGQVVFGAIIGDDIKIDNIEFDEMTKEK